MFCWEPEGRYCGTKSMAIAPFWFSTEYRWSALAPFWLSADDFWSTRQEVERFLNTVEPRYNEILGTMKITLLYQVSHYIRVKKQRNIKSRDQQNYLVIRGFCYIRPLYNEVPLYLTPSPSLYQLKFLHRVTCTKWVSPTSIVWTWASG